jgi:hypothetical protein
MEEEVIFQEAMDTEIMAVVPITEIPATTTEVAAIAEDYVVLFRVQLFSVVHLLNARCSRLYACSLLRFLCSRRNTGLR